MHRHWIICYSAPTKDFQPQVVSEFGPTPLKERSKRGDTQQPLPSNPTIGKLERYKGYFSARDTTTNGPAVYSARQPAGQSTATTVLL